jgi:hypothetical protein
VKKSTTLLASSLAIVALVGFPAAAHAVASGLTTVAVTVNDLPPTSMAQDDIVDVVTHGPIAQFGSAQHILYTSWSTQSLQLQAAGAYHATNNPNGLTYPEGWTLEYSTDGTNWSGTAPGDLTTVIAVRAKGDVSTKGRGVFETTTEAEPITTGTDFESSGGGDGYNVAFGNGIILNMYHHDTVSAKIVCKNLDGTECATPLRTKAGYKTNHASSLYFDKSTDRVYGFVYRSSDGHYGVLCQDYSDVAAVVDCPTEFTSLSTGFSGFNGHQGFGSSSQDGDVLWSIDGYNAKLMCFDMDTTGGDECDGGNNGFDVGTGGFWGSGFYHGRVTAAEGKVFFTIDDVMGCFDPDTTALCASSTPIDIGSDAQSNVDRHAPVPVRNTSGAFLGTCDISSKLCIDDAGATVTIPTGLSTYWTSTPPNDYIAGQNAQQWAITGAKFYYGGPERTGTEHPGFPFWSNDLVCWDFSTDALCVGFDGTDRGITTYYTANIDPDNPGCVWVNQDSGRIIPLNAETGEIGCSSGDAVVELPYAGVVPRMGCDSDGRVISWEDIQLNLNGLSPNDVAISIYDDNGAAVSSWQDLDVDSTGYLDISGLTVAESSTTPSIQIVGLNGTTIEELEAITGTVTFEAEEPELCFGLRAVTNCPDEEINNPAVPDVPSGIVEASSITFPKNGSREVGSKQRVTIAGTNSGNLCAASAWSAFVPTLAATGFDTVPVALGGLAAVAAGIGAALYTKRRRNG